MLTASFLLDGAVFIWHAEAVTYCSGRFPNVGRAPPEGMALKNRRPPSQLTPVDQILSRSLDSGFLSFINRQLKVFALWPLVIGPELTAKTKLDNVRDGRLTVLVAAPVWIDHLSYQKRTFLTQLNKNLTAEERIQDITFKVGQIE